MVLPSQRNPFSHPKPPPQGSHGMGKFGLGDLGAHEDTEQEALFLEELPLQELYGGLLFLLRKFDKAGRFGWFQYKSDALRFGVGCQLCHRFTNNHGPVLAPPGCNPLV